MCQQARSPLHPGDAGQMEKAEQEELDRFSDEDEAETTQLLELVGRGAFGCVFKAIYMGKLAAVKVWALTSALACCQWALHWAASLNSSRACAGRGA